MNRVLQAALMAGARAGCALLVTLLFAAPLRADSLETINLHHRMAEDLLPVLQPLVPAGAVVTGTGNLLLVRADAATLQQLRAVVASLDRAPRQLLITVGQTTTVEGSGTSVRGSGTIGSGNVQVGVNGPPQTVTGGQVIIRSGTATDDLRNVASVRALEGRESFIAMGQSRPFTSTSVSRDGRFPAVVTQTTEYRNVQSGFFVIPRLNGETVTLELSPTQQRFSANAARDGVVSTGTVTTTVAGRLGEWMPIGGLSETNISREAGLANRGARSDLTQYSAWVKVDEIR